ncbi:MAG: hypothetical protein RL701_7448 [Pseudomonadota bacterium]|jgi:hypothetical protein
MGQAIATADLEHFYRAGSLALRALQERGLGAERFSPNASARWRAFAGELTESQRLDLLIRDASVMYPLAFAARAVFALPGLARDEPFGPTWRSLPPSQAGALLREAEARKESATTQLGELLRAYADIWNLKFAGADEQLVALLGRVNAASRVIVAGAGAIVALAEHMAARNDCDLGDQVLLVTEQPGVRQLAGIAAALTGSRKTPRCVSVGVIAPVVQALGFDRASFAVVSADASSEAAAAARALATELGG